jgi:hypothetical protein
MRLAIYLFFLLIAARHFILIKNTVATPASIPEATVSPLFFFDKLRQITLHWLKKTSSLNTPCFVYRFKMPYKIAKNTPACYCNHYNPNTTKPVYYY